MCCDHCRQLITGLWLTDPLTGEVLCVRCHEARIQAGRIR